MISCFSQLLKSLIACNFLSHGSEIKFINDEDAAHAKLEVQNRSLIIAEKKLGIAWPRRAGLRPEELRRSNWTL
jgi:hypothetical protein